ncbi:MAG: hypothetical protein GX306_06070, partial [Clostridiales bacterium]|nr:hypothetical protein [Clostridiales bacterium]
MKSLRIFAIILMAVAVFLSPLSLSKSANAAKSTNAEKSATTLKSANTASTKGEQKTVNVYITIEEFAELIAKKIGLETISDLENAGIIKEGDFSNYTKNITRTDAAVLLNRADEYLYGDKLDPNLVELALEKRISDIEKIKKSKQIDVVKCYLKGFIKGYSNGKFSTDREFRGSSRMTREGALSCIKMLKDKSLRAKISPDGQLIRTTNL